MAGEPSEERWRPIFDPEAVLVAVISMLSDPNINSPANVDAAKQYRDDREGYNKKVRQLTVWALDDMEE